MSLRRLTRAVAAFALVAAVMLATDGARGGVAAGSGVPSYRHIFVVMLENSSYEQIIGNANASHINALARSYGLATRSYGVTHPSEPNYVATIGGDYFGIQDDAPFSATVAGVKHTIDGPSLASQLDAAGLSWKTYQGALPYPGYEGTQYPPGGAALYASKHDPFLNFKSVQGSRTELRKSVPDTEIATDLRSAGTTPNFSYIAPDQCHDMHGTTGCTDNATLVKDGDAYVGHLVAQIEGSPVWSTGNTAIVVTWDEDDYATSPPPGCCATKPGGGHIATIVITNHGPRGLRDSTPYNHYSLLRTVQDAFGLGCLRRACDTISVTPMTALFMAARGRMAPRRR